MVKRSKKNLLRILKKAEISTSTIVSLILLLVAVGIILYVVFGTFNWKGTIDKEACHESVVYRSLRLKMVEGADVFPLKCSTEKICFTMSGEDCKELTSTKKSPVRRVRLSKDSEKAKEEIKNVLSESMADCHWMLGEGELNFMGHDILPPNLKNFNKITYGLICTWFGFDDEAEKKIKSIGYGEIYASLEKKEYKDGISYLEYIYPGFKYSRDSIQLYNKIKENNPQIQKDFSEWKMDMNHEDGFVIFVIEAPATEWWPTLAGGATTLIVGGALTWITGGKGLMSFKGAGLISGAATAAGSAVFLYTYNKKYDYVPPTIYPLNATELLDKGVYSFEMFG